MVRVRCAVVVPCGGRGGGCAVRIRTAVYSLQQPFPPRHRETSKWCTRESSAIVPPWKSLSAQSVGASVPSMCRAELLRFEPRTLLNTLCQYRSTFHCFSSIYNIVFWSFSLAVKPWRWTENNSSHLRNKQELNKKNAILLLWRQFFFRATRRYSSGIEVILNS